MNALNYRDNLLFHLQEWQTSLITLTSKEAIVKDWLNSCKCTLTMHNTFDSFIINDAYFRYILTNLVDRERTIKINSVISSSRHSVFSFALEFLDSPITTVSVNFAKEFTTEKVQTIWFANHLQNIFRSKEIIGVNNGKFADFPPEIKEILNKAKGKTNNQLKNKIKKLKLTYRKAL
jgi:glycogen synthase